MAERARGGEGGLPRAAGSAVVGERRPAKGRLGCHTEQEAGVQEGAALCRPGEREKQGGVGF